MKNRLVSLTALSLWLLAAAPFAHGEGPILVFTGPTEAVAAGGPASIWLNALNQSDGIISWTVPAKIACRFVSPQAVLEGTLDLREPQKAGPVTVAPLAFVRREYLLSAPVSLAGQVVVEFSGLSANRFVLNMEASPAVAGQPEQKKRAKIAQLLADAEMEEPGQPYDPGRFFQEHFSGYEPFYFIAGTKSPNAKFQISFQYQLLNSHGALAQVAPVLKGFHLAYTQTTLWDLDAPSSPFFDTSYKPEVLYTWERVVGGKPADWFRLDLQGGAQHESNGQSSTNSRSLNIMYFRPTFIFGRDDSLQLTVQPRIWGYVGELDENPDLADYRGYGDLRAIVGWRRGLQLSAYGGMGKDGNHGRLQLDLTYPLMRLLSDSFTTYLQVQYFTGYGESLLRYNESSSGFRIGLAIYR